MNMSALQEDSTYLTLFVVVRRNANNQLASQIRDHGGGGISARSRCLKQNEVALQQIKQAQSNYPNRMLTIQYSTLGTRRAWESVANFVNAPRRPQTHHLRFRPPK